jgi:hypothetical protein
VGAAREPDQADFDLERFIDMFDEAMTSKDPRVINALRSLMMITTLVRPESGDNGLYNRSHGPLRRLYEDMNHLNRRISTVEDEVRQAQIERKRKDAWPEQEKYAMEAAKNLAQSMDRDVVMRQLSKETAMQINGGTIKGLK